MPPSNSVSCARQNRLPNLSPKLDRRLLGYAAAASAAGVGMMVLAPSSLAEVVYTPANQTVNGSLAIDLNNDGITDFTLNFGEGSCSSGPGLFHRRVHRVTECAEPRFDNVWRRKRCAGAVDRQTDWAGRQFRLRVWARVCKDGTLQEHAHKFLSLRFMGGRDRLSRFVILRRRADPLRLGSILPAQRKTPMCSSRRFDGVRL